MAMRNSLVLRASVALALAFFVSPSSTFAQLGYQSLSLVSHVRVHTRVEGVNDGRTVNQTHTISQPLPPQRFNFTGPTVNASTFPDPSPLDARGTVFPLHVEMRPQLFDWGNDYLIHAYNEHSEQGRAQAQFDTALVMTFTVGAPLEYSFDLGATAQPLNNLPLVGGTFAYDFRLFRDGIPIDARSRSAPPFAHGAVHLLEPGRTYRLEYDTLTLVNVSGLGPGGARLETGLTGNVSVLIQPIPEPAFAAGLGAGALLLVRRRAAFAC
jgi:hypothetical protein